MLRARATDSGEAAGRVRLYSSQALAHERCKPCSSEAPPTAARTRSKLSSRAAYASHPQPCSREVHMLTYQWPHACDSIQQNMLCVSPPGEMSHTQKRRCEHRKRMQQPAREM